MARKSIVGLALIMGFTTVLCVCLPRSLPAQMSVLARPQSCTITGTITTRGVGIAGAKVSCSGKSTTTSTTGAYSMAVPVSTTPTPVTVTKSGYYSETKTVKLPRGTLPLSFEVTALPTNNLIQNPSFEKPFVYDPARNAYTAAHWTQRNPLSAGYAFPESLRTGDYLPQTFYTGTEAVRTSVASSPPGRACYEQNVLVRPNSDYTACVWARGVDKLGSGTGFGAGASDSAGLVIEEYAADGVTLVKSYTKAAITKATLDMTNVKVAVHTGANTRIVRFVLDSYMACQEFYGWATYDEAVLDGPSPAAVTIGQVRSSLPVAECLPAKVVTAGFDGFFYIGEPDGSAGIRVIGNAVAGEVVDVAGTLSIADGELIIQGSLVNHRGWSKPPSPVAMSCHTAVTPSASGLYAAVAGVVQTANTNSFEIADGSGATLRVIGTARQGESVSVTGAIGMESVATAVLRPTSIAKTGPALVVRDCTLFDPISGSMLPGRTIVMEGDRISAIGTLQSPVQIPAGADVIEASGKFAIPGLIDGHVHSHLGLRYFGVTAAEIMPLYVAYGVTSIRNVGDQMIAQATARQYANTHPELCPRFFTCSPFIDGNPPIHAEDAVGITDPAQVPTFLDQMVACGVSTVKCYATVGKDVFVRVVQEAHLRGLPVTAHLGVVFPQDAVPAGVDCLEHITSGSLDPAVVIDMAARGVGLVATLVVTRNYSLLGDLPEVSQSPDLARVPARLLNAWNAYLAGAGFTEANRPQRQAMLDIYKAITGAYYAYGVSMLAGSDAPMPFVPPGGSMHQELELLVQSGIPPAAVLQAATINNARMLKQENRLGSIEVGKLADMVIVNADPLADIRNTRSIQSVIRGGRALTQAELFAAVPP